MALVEGTRLGTYEIRAAIGAGGMGEVYRARDLTLNRDVAIKVLPAAFATDLDRVARLAREAQVLASFNHRNVAAIYGVQETGDTRALVMELINGPTLADRIAGGPLPLPEVLRIARQIAEALEAAHEQGIVHRDLKPANIKVRPDGEVKVLDFGLAKALDPLPSDEHHSPSTLPRSPVLTAEGAIVGTVRYMSPEQARGLGVDRRTDLWAFGVVLWEMLTGRYLFAGTASSDIIAALLTTEPDWTRLPNATPPAIQRLLQRALRKDRRERLDSASVAKLDIDEALAEPKRDQRPRLRPRSAGAWMFAGAVLASLLLFVLLPRREQTPPSVIRLSAETGAGVTLRKDLGPAAVLSPDGQTLVLASATGTLPSMLYVRRLDEGRARSLPGTEGATNPFFSPDGQWVGFFAEGALKRIAITGGAPVTLADLSSAGSGGTWSEQGIVLYGSLLNRGSVVRRMDSAGGLSQPVTALAEGELSHRWPQVLPGGRAVLFTSNTTENLDDARIMAQPLPSGQAKLVQPGFHGRFVPGGRAGGHLLYVKGGALHAAPFNLERLEVTGPSVSMVEGVVADTSTGGAQFAISDTGTLVLSEGRGYSPAALMAWIDRGGTIRPIHPTPVDWGNAQVSPDGNLVALDIAEGNQLDIFLLDLTTGKLSRLTFNAADDSHPVWSPDGTQIIFSSTRDGAPNLYWQRADGTGTVSRLTRSDNPQTAASWHPTRNLLAFVEVRQTTQRDVLILPLEQEGAVIRGGQPWAFAASPANEREPAFSPDGRWLAYHANETGRGEVFVRGFPGDGKWQVSSTGGRDATWSRDRPELLYFGVNEDRIMVAPFTVRGSSFRAEPARAWSTTLVGRPERTSRTFAIHPDGERLLVVPAETQGPDHLTFIFNFHHQLRRAVPGAE